MPRADLEDAVRIATRRAASPCRPATRWRPCSWTAAWAAVRSLHCFARRGCGSTRSPRSTAFRQMRGSGDGSAAAGWRPRLACPQRRTSASGTDRPSIAAAAELWPARRITSARVAPVCALRVNPRAEGRGSVRPAAPPSHERTSMRSARDGRSALSRRGRVNNDALGRPGGRVCRCCRSASTADVGRADGAAAAGFGSVVRAPSPSTSTVRRSRRSRPLSSSTSLRRRARTSLRRVCVQKAKVVRARRRGCRHAARPTDAPPDRTLSKANMDHVAVTAASVWVINGADLRRAAREMADGALQPSTAEGHRPAPQGRGGAGRCPLGPCRAWSRPPSHIP